MEAGGQPVKRPVVERFWEKVSVGAPDECWPWMGALNADDYGVFRVDHKDVGLVYTHRLAWCFANGPIPAGLEIMHTCPTRPRLRRCCNPAHLVLGTHADNSAIGERDFPGGKHGRCWGAPRALTVAA